jgi:transcriptional regulator with XRE-family HTH domain
MAADLGNLRVLRKVLGVSQSRMAAMLGVSTRAVQSYEQGWRKTPAMVQKLAGFLLAEQWRGHNPDAQPCWEIKHCSDELRETCPTFQLNASHCCWLIKPNCPDLPPKAPWAARLSHCGQCEAGARMVQA